MQATSTGPWPFWLGMQLSRLDPDFEAFVRARSGALLHAAVLLTGDRQHGEDLLQQALWKVARRWASARDSPEAYARAALATLAVDRWRALRARPAEARYEPAFHDVGAASPTSVEDRDALLRALRQLPRSQRVVLVLRFFEDMSVDDTARLLSISTGAVKSATSRGLASLRSVIRMQDREEQPC